MLGNHLLGLYEKALPPEMDWQQRLTAAGALGFDFLEISIDENDRRLARLTMGAQERRALHRAVEESGVPLQTMCLSGHRRFPLGSADPAVRARGGEIMEQAIRFAGEFGIRVIQLAGYDVYYEPSTEESLRRFLQGLQTACRLAERYQVMLAVEIMDTPLLSSITRYLELKAHLPSPWFRVYPDLGNLTAWGNDVPAELALGRDEIVSVHIKDTCPVSEVGGGRFKCVPFGGGTVDFTDCFRRLEAQDYCGPYMIEMWHQPGQDWKTEIGSARAFVAMHFEAAEGLK